MNITQVYINSLKQFRPCRVIKENALSVVLEVDFEKEIEVEKEKKIINELQIIKKSKKNLISK